MKNYESIDGVIEKWAHENNLFLLKFYKEDEVRSVDYLSSNGKKFPIWIDPPINEKVSIHIWDYKKFRKDWVASLDNLFLYLNKTILFIKNEKF